MPGRVLLLLFLLVSLGCGSAPGTTAPTPTPPAPPPPTGPVVNMAGTWTGTVESANFAPRAVTLTVVQADNCVDGVWTDATGDWKGAISGLAAADSFSGQISLERTANGGGKCEAGANISGPVAGDSFRWTAGALGAVGTCSGGLPQTFVLSVQRQK